MKMSNNLQSSTKSAKFVVLLALCACLVGSSVADDGAATSMRRVAKSEISGVVIAVKHYARSVSCDFKVNPTKVAGLNPYNSNDAKFGKKYVALWDGDIGCAGGSGNYQTHIAVVRYGDTGRFLVDPLASSPVVRFESPVQLTTKLVRLDSQTITLEGLEEGPNDPLCCPSVPLRFTLRLDGKENWVLVEKHVLKSIK
jgi:hypothetical protein